jgi:hypothetical protein
MICSTVDAPGTFAHQASVTMLQRYPELGVAVTHFPSTDALWSALDEGLTNVIVVAEQTSPLGWDDVHRQIAAPTSDLYVRVALAVPYGCTLLAKPGSRLEHLTCVYGDASIRLCGTWLDANLPGLPRIVHSASLVDAAQKVLDGDGTLSLVATESIGSTTGMVPLALGIDGGATCNWWAISKVPMFAARPGRLLISARFADSGELGDLTSALWDHGFRLTTAYSQATSRLPFEHDYILAFAGEGRLIDVTSELHRYPDARLRGAFEQRE